MPHNLAAAHSGAASARQLGFMPHAVSVLGPGAVPNDVRSRHPLVQMVSG